MTAESIRLFVTGHDSLAVRRAVAESDFGPFDVVSAQDLPAVVSAVSPRTESLVIVPASAIEDAADRRVFEQLAADVAAVVVLDAEDPQAVLSVLRSGAEDTLTPTELAHPSLPRRLRAAVERKRAALQSRQAYATDLSTGLPHQQQLIEHMSHLMALREREPAPMAVLVLRTEGLATTEARHGREAAQVLRRKLAVRLRAGVRASDVVAFIGADTFAVLLASILAPADAQRVGSKLLAALQVPFNVGGRDLAVSTALGVGQYPADGNQPDALLRKAIALASATPAVGRSGHANFNEAGGVPAAANDE